MGLQLLLYIQNPFENRISKKRFFGSLIVAVLHKKSSTLQFLLFDRP